VKQRRSTDPAQNGREVRRLKHATIDGCDFEKTKVCLETDLYGKNLDSPDANTPKKAANQAARN
jgi:hypothetical protein